MDIIELNDEEKILEVFEELKESFYDFQGDLKQYAKKMSTYAKVFALMDESPLGVIAFYANNEAELTAYLTTILVKKEFQSRGIGNSLIEKMESYCKKEGFKHIKLEVNQRNQRAINFYLKKGYHIISKNGDKSVFMEKVMEK